MPRHGPPQHRLRRQSIGRGGGIQRQACPFQAEATTIVERHLRTSAEQAAMLVADCGCGKTVMALHLVAALGRRALVLVHTTTLAGSGGKSAHGLSCRTVALRVSGGTNALPDDFDVAVAMIQTVARGADTSSCGTVVIDECHRAAAPSSARSSRAPRGDTGLGCPRPRTAPTVSGRHCPFSSDPPSPRSDDRHRRHRCRSSTCTPTVRRCRSPRSPRGRHLRHAHNTRRGARGTHDGDRTRRRGRLCSRAKGAGSVRPARPASGHTRHGGGPLRGSPGGTGTFPRSHRQTPA